MVDIFNRIVLKVIAAKLTREVGWLKIRNRPLEVMTDVLHRFMKDMSIRVYRYAELSGRTEPCVYDISLVLQDMNIDVVELEKYKHRTRTTRFHISQYPVPSQEQLIIPNVPTDLDDESAMLNSENGNAGDHSQDTSANALLQNDFDVNSGSREQQPAVSFLVDESEKCFATDVGRNKNEMEELNEKNMTTVPKENCRKRSKKDKPSEKGQYVASCNSNTKSDLKANEISVHGGIKNDVTSEKAPMDDIPASDELHIHLDFPKIIIKRVKAKNLIFENSSTKELSGNTPFETTNISVQRKAKRKQSSRKKVKNIKKGTLRDNATHKNNEKMCAILF